MERKRFLAIVMTVFMVFAMLPSMVFAAAPSGELGGKLKIKGLAAVGTTLSADYTKVTPEGVTDDDVTFSWSRQTGEKELVEVGTEKNYTVTQDDLGYKLVLTVTGLDGSELTGTLTAKTPETAATEEEAKAAAQKQEEEEQAAQDSEDTEEVEGTLEEDGTDADSQDAQETEDVQNSDEAQDSQDQEEYPEDAQQTDGEDQDVQQTDESTLEDVPQTEESQDSETQDPENQDSEEMHIYTESELQPDGTEKTTDNTTDNTADSTADNTSGDSSGDESEKPVYEAQAYIDGTEEGKEPVCDFGTVTPSDETQSQMMFVDIKNTGTGTLNFKSISPEHFMVADIEEPLAAGESVSVWIQPRDTLEAGSYDDTITYETEEGAEVSFQVKAVVEEQQPSEEPTEDPTEDPEPTETPSEENPEPTGTLDPADDPDNEEPELERSISADTDILSFDNLEEGYEQVDAKTVTIQKTGEVTLDAPQSDYFDITLVKEDDTSAVYSVQPIMGLEAGTYSDPILFTIAEDPEVTAEVNAEITVNEAKRAELSVDPDEIDFGETEAGYSKAPSAEKVTVTNEGNTTITLSKPESESQTFKTGKLSATELAPGESASFKIRPEDGLGEGVYTETVAIPNNQGVDAVVNVKFTVIAATVKLTGIQAPSDVTDVKNGAEKTAKALGLPSSVVINTTNGDMKAKVQWNVKESSYDPSVKTAQSFKVKGTVTLPDRVENPDGINLITAVNVTVKAGRTAKIADPADNKIKGISSDGYTTQSKITFEAVGAGMDNENPGKGDTRYVPYNWKVLNTNSWSQAPYTAAFVITKAGTYTLTVVFDQQKYTGSKWENTGSQDTKQVNFTITQGQQITATPTPQPNSANQKKAVQTGDTTNIAPFVIILVIAAGCIAGVVVYKKKKK